MNNTRKIRLRDGGILEVSCTDTLLNQVRSHYKISSENEVSDHYLSEYILRACQTAVEKAEKAEIEEND